MAIGGDKLKPHAAQLEAWAIEGVPVAEQVNRLARMSVAVDRRAIYKWRQRHPDAISVATAIVRQVVVGRSQSVAISDQTERIRRLAVLVEDMERIREERGLLVTEYKSVGGVIIEHERFDAALVREYRGALHDVAVELGQLEEIPAQPPSTSEVHATFQTLILADPEYRAVAQRLFVGAAMGARDASGTRLVRKRRDVAAGAAPDADQRRPAADRVG